MMKSFLILVTVLFFSCSKEKQAPVIIGKWNLIQSNAGTGYGFVATNYQPATELSINFRSNGKLELIGPNPGIAHSCLWNYNQYEVLSESLIRFTNAVTPDTMTAYYTIDRHLSLFYDWARCGYEEKFVQH